MMNNISGSFISTSNEKKPQKLSLPNQHRPTRGQRLSLPQTCGSSTRVNAEKVQRRLSGRLRQNSFGHAPHRSPSQSSCHSSSSSRENVLPHYSPPLTRSTKKKKNINTRSPAVCMRNGVLLEFSPPDQEENERREKESIRQIEEERARRIERARRNGQLLVYDTTNLELTTGNILLEKPSVIEHASQAKGDPPDDVSESEQKSTASSPLTEVQSQTVRTNMSGSEVASELKSLKSLFLAQSNKHSTDNMLVHQDFFAKHVQDMADKMSNLKETHAGEKIRLELELEHALSNIKQLEEAKNSVEEQLKTLQLSKDEHFQRIKDLEDDIKLKEQVIAELKKVLETIKEENESEKEELALEIDRLESHSLTLEDELNKAKNLNDQLYRLIEDYEGQVENFENITIPSLKLDLEKEQQSILEKEKTQEELEKILSERDNDIKTLKEEVENLRALNDKERLHSQSLSENSEIESEALRKKLVEKDQEINELSDKLQKMKELVDEAQQEVLTASVMLKESESKWSADSTILNQALAEYMEKYDNLEKHSSSLQQKLDYANETIDKLTSSKVAVETKSTEACAIVSKLKQELENERLLHEEEKKLRQQEHQFREVAEVKNSQLEVELQEMIAERDAAQENYEKENQQLEVERRLREVIEQENSRLEQELQETIEERDMARDNMLGFNDREAELYRKLRESDRIRREQHNRLMQLMGNIRVFVRIRPPLPGEAEAERQRAALKYKRKRVEDEDNDDEDEENIFKFPGYYEHAKRKNQGNDDLTKHVIEILAPWEDRGGLKDRRKRHRFGFDSVFSPHHSQKDIWEATEPLIQSAIDGFNVTLFAYGQTGSGKTYTMLGDDQNKGVIGRAVEKLFIAKRDIEMLSRDDTSVSISVELLEVYNEKVRDLLASGSAPEVKVTAKEEVVGNIIATTPTEQDVLRVLALAQSRRCVKSTASNSESSRSHMVFTIHFDVKMSDGMQRNGRLNICDLAGSERLSKSGANNVGGALLKETQNINKSLSVLSTVIERLQAGDKNVPFRESQLTFLLKNSLSGNSKTLAIVCCNPLAAHYQESISSLRFAEKVSRVEMKAYANFSC